LEGTKGQVELTSQEEPPDDGPAQYDHDLRRKTRWSILWTIVRVASDQVFSFVIFVILARLLSPQEVGTFALAMAFSSICRPIAIGGLVQTIPRAKKVTPTLVDTVFWTNLGMAFLVALVVLVLAPPIMDLIDQPDATRPLQALGFVLPIAALGATHMSLRLREFGHKSLALRSVVGGTIGGTVAVAAAFAGWGVWSLVVQRFVTEASNALLSWFSYKWTPGRNFSMTQLRSIWAYGFNVGLTQIIGMLPRRALDMIIGMMIGAAAVGINRTAGRTTELVASGTLQPFTTVALQTLSRLQGETGELVKAYRWMLSRSAMITFPALIGFGVLAPDAVPAIYGAKWAAAGQLAQIFAFMVVPYSLSSFVSPLLMALGRSATMQTFAFGQVIATIIFAALAAPFGLIAVAWVSVARTYLALPFQMWMLRRVAGISPRHILSAIAAPLGASLIMASGVWGLMEIIRPHFRMVLVSVFICVAAGMLIYAIALYAISADARSLVRYRLKDVRARLRK